MEEPKTWRELLGQVTSEPREKQRVAEALGINPITLTRWVTYKSNPRPDNLRPLLNVLPSYRKQFAALIAREYPHIFHEVASANDIQPDIPSAFYARVLNAHTTSPPMLRAASVCILILQQILEHLDPHHRGMAVVVLQCIPPLPGRRVRSVRKTLTRGTVPWNSYENQTLFLGAESLAGHALISGRFTTIQSREEKKRMFPTHYVQMEESTVAYPILLADRTAGCLYIVSTQRNYFSQVHLDLIQRYVDLMVLAFSDNEFYPLQSIELGLMPSYDQQLPYLTTVQRRVTQLIIEASRDHQPLTRPEAEQAVWQAIEDELLRLTMNNKEGN